MKKGFKSYVICWIILLAIFNVIVFVTPNEIAGMTKFGGAFWSGYILIMLTFIGQLVCANYALKAETKEKLFLNLPIITISYSTLIASIVLGTICMAVPNMPNWAGVIISALLLCFNAISIVKANAAADIVTDIGNNVKTKTQFIKLLTVYAENLCGRAKNDEERNLTKKVYEAIRYSDPMSNDALSVTEAKITVSFEVFSKEINTENADNIICLLKERNNKCKVLK